MAFLDTILEIVFPSRCVGCGAKGGELCMSCISDSPTAEKEVAKWIFPIFEYRHPPIRKALGVFKYKNKKRLAKIFAELLYDKIIEELSELSMMENFRNPVLIPIPLYKSRARERGYNQALLLCEEIIKINYLRDSIDGEKLNLEKNVLIKSKETEHQARIKNRSERLKNVIGSFTAQNTEHVKGRNVILIDDITTTGATLSEAKKILKRAGARKIIAFTVAH